VITEADVTLTDWALAIEAAVLATLLGRSAPAWQAFFGSIGVAAFLGGVTHGFFADGLGWAATALWRATLLALGVTSVAAIVAGAEAVSPGLVRGARRAAIVGMLAYAAVIVFVTDTFAVAVIAYLPATLFLLAVFAIVYRRTRERGSLAGVAGLGVLLLGSWVQWRGLSVPALGLTHNALYHVIQALALPLIYRGAMDLRARAR